MDKSVDSSSVRKHGFSLKSNASCYAHGCLDRLQMDGELQL